MLYFNLAVQLTAKSDFLKLSANLFVVSLVSTNNSWVVCGTFNNGKIGLSFFAGVLITTFS